MAFTDRLHNRGSISTGYDIDNSVKLEDANSEWFYNASPTAGNRRTYTFSFWIKRTEIGAVNASGNAYVIGAGQHGRMFFGGDYFQYRFDDGHDCRNVSVQFRDTSAWYHFVVAVDTNQLSSSNRVKLYVNGESLAVDDHDGGSFPDLADQGAFFSTNYLTIGTAPFGGTYNVGDGDYDMSGYLSEFCAIDGQQLDPTSFGEYDEDSGIWKPIDVSGLDFGSQGYYLNFSDSANLGDDASGNSNDFTENNITSADQATDTATNNGCTLNVLASLEGSNDITEGALVSTGGSGSFNGTYGTIGIDPFNSTVDWYWEIEASSTTNGSTDDIGIGWIKESRITSGSTAYNNVYADGISRYSSQTATAAGDIWGVLLETGATPVFKLYRNDSLIHTSTNGIGGVSFDTLMFPYITVKGTGTDARLNFLNPASSFSIASGNTDPNGYGNFEFDTKGGYALCTKNLAEYG